MRFAGEGWLEMMPIRVACERDVKINIGTAPDPNVHGERKEWLKMNRSAFRT